MEKINNTPNEAPPVIYKLDDIPRCPDCNLICSLKLNYIEGNPMIEYECENNHKGNISLKEYLNKCNKFICFSCQLNHPFGERHNIINFKRYDSLCKMHSNTFCFYCIKCKKNLCIYCKSEHEFHDLIDLSKFLIFISIFFISSSNLFFDSLL